MCLNCEKEEVWDGKRLNGEIQRNWDLCKNCYDQIWKNLDSIIMYQKNYWKIYKSYGIKKEKSQGGPLCLWYSVRPSEGIDELDFVDRIKKFISSCCIIKAIYQFEWKYEKNIQGGTLRNGIHCHMLIFGKIKRVNFHIERQKEKYFNLNKKQKFWIYEKELIADKIDYLQGRTLSNEKNEEKLLDIETRKELGLLDPYVKNVSL